MQEIAIFLSSVAGVATAAAIRKFPKKPRIGSIGANSQIKSQIHSLNIEKEILSKTISRLYHHDGGLSKIQRDRLLVRYQHQLGIVLAKIEKLEAASKHPDLGPVGDGLITLMDQKLSQLDERLYEISSKLSVANVQASESKQKAPTPFKNTIEKTKEAQVTPQVQKETLSESKEMIHEKPRAVEITTLTELPTKISEFPKIDGGYKPQQKKLEEKMEILQASIGSSNLEKYQITPEVPKQETISQPIVKPKPTIKLPEEEKIEEDDNDLDKIKGEIMKTLSKLEQAEVE